jgi:hypothetical protein
MRTTEEKHEEAKVNMYIHTVNPEIETFGAFIFQPTFLKKIVKQKCY